MVNLVLWVLSNYFCLIVVDLDVLKRLIVLKMDFLVSIFWISCFLMIFCGRDIWLFFVVVDFLMIWCLIILNIIFNFGDVIIVVSWCLVFLGIYRLFVLLK